MMTRRHFIGTVGGLAAAAGLGIGFARAPRRHLPPAQISAGVLRPLTGATLNLVAADGHRLRAVVAAVHDRRRPARHGAPATEEISLLLAADSPEAPGGTYRVVSDELDFGTLDFTAVGREGRDRRLEAVFTRIV